MVTSLLKSLGKDQDLAGRLLSFLLTPAFFFWCGGILAVAYEAGWEASEKWLESLKSLNEMRIILYVAGILVLSVVLGFVVSKLSFSVIRLMEGYWPGWMNGLRSLLVAYRRFRLKQWKESFRKLADKGVDNLSANQAQKYVWLDWAVARSPKRKSDMMPTKIGNILKSAETYPFERYGIGTVICWSRLWLLLPQDARQGLSAGRTDLDNAAQLMVLGLFFFAWSFWAWWAWLVGSAVIIVGYCWMVRAAQEYGELIRSTFDLYRTSLYKALRWPLPDSFDTEAEMGKRLTDYLWRGPGFDEIPFKPVDE